VQGFDIVSEALRKSFTINGKASSTLNNYLRCLAHLAIHTKTSPEKLSKTAINDYLFHCQHLHKTPSESFFKHTIFGLRALYKVLGMSGHKVMLPQIKRDTKLPIVLSKSEIKALLNAPKYLKHRLMLAVLYGCGLRSYELCDLRLSDVDFERKTVFVKKKKGIVDRYVPLSDHLARGLQKYFQSEQPQVYVFNSQKTDDGAFKPLTTRAVQWLIKECRSKINTNKPITAHTLRHTYATHLLEDGLNIMSLKELLGHAHIETTLVYLHVANTGSSKKFSPLDTLYK
jgi:site-specific recombinase XerD